MKRNMTLLGIGLILLAAVIATGCVQSQAPVGSVAVGFTPQVPYPPLNGRMVNVAKVNVALPAAGTNLLSTNITLPWDLQPPVTFPGVLIAANTSGILSVSRTLSRYDGTFAVSDEILNGGLPLFPNQTYVFVVPMLKNEALNLHYGASPGILSRLAIQDLYDGGYSSIQVINGTVSV
jgi:hypothetical protein